MTYDPSTRGPAPVGVRSVELLRNRPLPVELWYPASAQYRGQDLEEATRDRFVAFGGAPEQSQDALRDATCAEGSFPLVIYSHGANGNRYNATFLNTHLASHGYVVAALDHTGNTTGEMMAAVASGKPPDAAAMTHSMEDRPFDVSFVADAVLEDAGGLAAAVDPNRIGVMGLSFGGWTTLATQSVDSRFLAAFAMAPAWGKGPLGTETLSDAVDLASWGRDVPTLLLAADLDALVMIDAMHELYQALPGTRRMVVLRGAGHVHFADHVPESHEMLRLQFGSGMLDGGADIDIDFKAVAEAMRPAAELIPEAPAHACTRALGLAHMDAFLKLYPDAQAFLERDLEGRMQAQGIRVQVRG